MGDRNRVFQHLKAPCVALSQAALALHGAEPDVWVVVDRLEDLRRELSRVKNDGSSLDKKLADYVFFPLSQVLKASQKVSIRCLELAFQCLAILIDRGWRSSIQSPLAAQIVILCTMMAEKEPKGLTSTESTDELQTSALWCLFYLFEVVDSAASTKAFLISEANFPQLGQTISNVLDAIVEGRSIEVQIVATNVLRSLMKNLATREIMARFLPGIVSRLTKVLMSQTTQRRNYNVLVGSLEVLRILFQQTLGDDTAASVTHATDDGRSASVIDQTWLATASSQLKSPIMSIMKLRSHSRTDVKEALAQLCFTLLKDCRQVLSDCSSLALEALLSLSSGSLSDAIRFRLEALVSGDSAIAKLLRDALHGWTQSLPTKMQAADDQAKLQALQQVTAAYGIVLDSGVETGIIDRLLAHVLRDCIVVDFTIHRQKQEHQTSISSIQRFDIAKLSTGCQSTTFRTSPLVRYRGQEEIMTAIETLVRRISSSPSQAFAADLALNLRQSHGEIQIACFTLLLKVIEAALEKDTTAEALIAMENEPSDPSVYRDGLEELYSLSLSILADSDDEPVNSRLQALALRAVALRARTAGADFKFELIDALYPVLHMLATPSEQLQGDSITTLNILTASCGYQSVVDLIVENVDYLTNAVALKLNAFDVSPQAPQVLLMMVRLAGPSLLPYLEDTIDSIFAALEDFHGYPLLVELLFKVLSAVAEEGAKNPQLAITEKARDDLSQTLEDTWQPIDILDLVEQLRSRSAEKLKPTTAAKERVSHPQQPWKPSQEGPDDESQGDDDDDQQVEEVETPAPAPKTYKLMLRISELTQHYLPSASVSLRSSLLGLIKTTTPALARHENSFLPLINTLWPEVVSRLNDSEPHVVAITLDIMALLFEHAGDFMQSRILQLWPGLMDVYSQSAKDVVQSNRATISESDYRQYSSHALVLSQEKLKQAVARLHSTPADYSDTSSRLIWTATIKAITAAVQHVQLPPDQLDQALEMLEPVLVDDRIRRAIETVNPDAVWLLRMRNGSVAEPEYPRVATDVSWRFAAVPG